MHVLCMHVEMDSYKLCRGASEYTNTFLTTQMADIITLTVQRIVRVFVVELISWMLYDLSICETVCMCVKENI